MKTQNNKIKNKQYFKIGILGVTIALLMMSVPAMSNTVQIPQVQVYAQTATNTNANNSTPVDSDEMMADIEKDIPGFGGAFMDKNGVLNVYKVSSKAAPTQNDAERSAYLGKHFGPEYLSKGMISLEGKYTFSELLAYKQKLSSLLDKKMNVTAVGIDKTKNMVMIGVEKIDDAGLAIKEMSKLGIPKESVGIVETGKIALTSHTQKYRPVTGGVQLEYSNFFTVWDCSVGISADRGTSRVTVTAGHCSLNPPSDNTAYYQCCYPWDGIGNGIAGTNKAGSRYSDSVLISPTVSTSRGVVHRDSGGDLTLQGKQYIDLVGNSISKSGRTTMDTNGVITYTCINTASSVYGTLYCQDYASYSSDLGDSGGTVYGFDINSGTYKWYGITWGKFTSGPYSGNSIFSTVKDIENDQGTLTIN